MAQTTVNANAETNEILKQLESKMSGIMGVVDSLSRKIEETNDMFVSSDSAYFLNMADALSTSMHESEMDRRLYEEAMEQNRRAMELSGAKGPERGDSTFWQQAFTPTPVSPAETQANALKSTFTDSGVMDAFKSMLSGITKQDDSGSKNLNDIIKDAVRGKVDDRTFGEKALDKIGLGSINKLKNWWADRDVKKEQKATEKDQGTIKREQKKMDRLAATYRKLKGSGASEDELNDLRDKYISHKENQEAAAYRISKRSNDDLFETSMPSKADASMKSMMDMVMKSLSVPGTQIASGIKPAVDVSAALTPTVARPRLQQLMDDEIADDARTKDVTGDKNEPVELAKETDGSLGAVGDKKEAADIQRKLDTTLRPDFYKEGIQFFKKGNSGALFDGLSGMLGGGGMGSLGKAGLYAAAAAAVGASLAKIGQAAMLVKDWFNASSEAVENVKKMTDQNIANLEKRKKGHNDEMITASQESLRAQQQLHESEESWNDSLGTVFIDHGPLSWLGFKSDRKKAREAKEAADKKTDAERKKYEAMRAAAQKSGVDIKNDAELNKFKALYDKGQADQYKAAKLAAGNMQESGQQSTAQTPGAKAEPDKAVSAEEQMKRHEEATYNATKRALLDNDVQRQNEENAKIQGQQIDQSLNGRK